MVALGRTVFLVSLERRARVASLACLDSLERMVTPEARATLVCLEALAALVCQRRVTEVNLDTPVNLARMVSQVSVGSKETQAFLAFLDPPDSREDLVCQDYQELRAILELTVCQANGELMDFLDRRERLDSLAPQALRATLASLALMDDLDLPAFLEQREEKGPAVSQDRRATLASLALLVSLALLD